MLHTLRDPRATSRRGDAAFPRSKSPLPGVPSLQSADPKNIEYFPLLWSWSGKPGVSAICYDCCYDCLFVQMDMSCLFVCLAGHFMIVCLFNWTYFMILKVNKWPPGGAGIVLRLKTRIFRYFLVNFDDFLPNFR